MARKMPKALLYLLDESVYVDQYDPHHEKCLVKVDLRPIMGGETEESLSLNQGRKKNPSMNSLNPSHHAKREVALLTCLLETCRSLQDREQVLTHPVIKVLLHLKWQRAKRVFWAAFISYFAWVLLFTEFILHVYLVSCPCEFFIKGRRNETGNGLGCSKPKLF
jgi:hypothetical protein